MAEQEEQYKDYLGDSVYARFDGYNIVLYLDNGLGIDTEICLEPSVLKSFGRYQERIEDMIKEKRKAYEEREKKDAKT